MSRLDSFIRRMQAQRDCLNHVAPLVRALPGPILEVGLGNGRTYDHLRELFPDRDVYVFDRRTAAAPPDCIPPADHLLLGEVSETVPRARRRLGATAALIHTDLGIGDGADDDRRALWLGPALDSLLAPGGYVVANQPLEVRRWRRLDAPAGVAPDRYFIYCADP